MKTSSKRFTIIALSAIIACATAVGQISMMPLVSEDSESKAPTDGSWLMLLPQVQSMQWTSGYCYGLAAASYVLQQATSLNDLATLAVCIEAVERQALLTTEISLYIGTKAAAFGAPWYTEPLYALRKGDQ